MAKKKEQPARIEFIDEDHEVMGPYYEILESYTGRNRKTTEKKLRKLIDRDPDFFDPYVRLAHFARSEGDSEEARILIDTAYERASRYITDEKGTWPDVLEWSWMENRHIIRAFLEKGIQSWRDENIENALDMFRKLLRTNPADNPGVRYFILAILENMSFEEFDDRFAKGGFYTPELDAWFIREIKKYPDEFGWWEKEMEKYY